MLFTAEPERRDAGQGKGNLEKPGRAKVVCGREVGCREQRRGREGRRFVSKSTNWFSSFWASKTSLA